MLKEIETGIWIISTNDWERRLFDELIPLPDGTSYNAYVIKGTTHNALIDSSDIRKIEPFLNDLQSLSLEKIDYIIANHAEPDHSGAILDVLTLYPKAKIVCTEKCKEILVDLLHIPPETFVIVTHESSIDLGGRTLNFIPAPWVHWPETMFTYLNEEKILFTCDFLGNHIASSEVYSSKDKRTYIAAKRYYAEIMMPFRKIIKRHLDTIEKLDISLIATSHGLIYDDPGFIINAYKEWASDKVKNEVVIPYVSMYGSTEKMVEYLTENLIKRGITVKPFMLTTTDIGELAMSLVDCASIVIGSPTVLTGPHPAVVYATYLANLLKPKAKFATVIGSYGWKGSVVDQIVNLIPKLKVELFNPVIIKGKPRDEDFSLLDNLVDEIVRKHEELGLFNHP
ncbi:MBL fold hydrolase [Candidatus Heimdallarchaeota archaeon B3_Heim]|nr:MAG: MBL fold hydrolase [Candidatus Heimdallarchaeota archaeon B3_Heim]